MQSVADNVKDILTNYGICEPIVEIIQDTMRLETYVRVSGFVEGKEYHQRLKRLEIRKRQKNFWPLY